MTKQKQEQKRARGGVWGRLVAGLCLGAALLVAACAAEDGPPAPAGEACGSEGLTCRDGTTCVSYAAIFECVRPCETTSACGMGSCCTHRDKVFAPYCVALGDPLGRAGSECLP